MCSIKSLVREIENEMYVGRDQWDTKKEIFWESKKRRNKRRKDFRSKI
jgi:hypothetical protein